MNAIRATTKEHNFGDGELFTYFGRNPKGPWQRAGVVSIIRKSERFRYEIVAVDSGLRLETATSHTKFWASRPAVAAVQA